MFSRARLALIPSLCVIAGCGSDGESAGDAPMGYLPADTAVAITVSTDFESDEWQSLEERLLAGPLVPNPQDNLFGEIPTPTSLEGFLRQAGALAGLDYDEDIEPLLGERIVAGYTTFDDLIEDDFDSRATFVAALDTGNEELLRSVLEPLGLSEQAEHEGVSIYADQSGYTQVGVDGTVLLFAVSEQDYRDGDERPPIPRPSLAEAITRDRAGDGLNADAFEPPAEAPDEALLQAHGDLSTLLTHPEVAPLTELPWVAALESFDAAISFSDESILATGVINTDATGLTETDLPLATGVETPELVRNAGEIAGASANQSVSTTFLLEAARAAFPNSRFVEDVATVERELGIDFEEEFLRQFDGPSASTLPLSDEFAARSTIVDRKAMAKTLRALAPDIGRLIQDLQALQGRGLIPLFLFAPDAPIAPGVLGDARIKVSTVPGERDLYEVSNLIPEGFQTITPLPAKLVFGLIDDVFVVASDEARAREIAGATLEPAPEGLQGASVAVGDLAPLRDNLEELFGFDPGPLGELTASAEANVEGLTGTARISIP